MILVTLWCRYTWKSLYNDTTLDSEPLPLLSLDLHLLEILFIKDEIVYELTWWLFDKQCRKGIMILTCFWSVSRPFQVNISGVGELSLWEFSGHEAYFPVYDHFIGNTSCVHLIVFPLNQPFDVQLQQCSFWMSFLQARIPPMEPLSE